MLRKGLTSRNTITGVISQRIFSPPASSDATLSADPSLQRIAQAESEERRDKSLSNPAVLSRRKEQPRNGAAASCPAVAAWSAAFLSGWLAEGQHPGKALAWSEPIRFEMSMEWKGVATRRGKGLLWSKKMGSVARSQNRVLRVGIVTMDSGIDSRPRGGRMKVPKGRVGLLEFSRRNFKEYR